MAPQIPQFRRKVLQVSGTVLLAFVAGCDFGRLCTLIGCVNGLYVDFGAPSAVPYRIEVTSGGLGTVHTYDCTVVTQCFSDGAIFEDYFPSSVTIKVITATGTTTTNATPIYTESHPNGKGCGPTCRQARVTVPAPTA